LIYLVDLIEYAVPAFCIVPHIDNIVFITKSKGIGTVCMRRIAPSLSPASNNIE